MGDGRCGSSIQHPHLGDARDRRDGRSGDGGIAADARLKSESDRPPALDGLRTTHNASWQDAIHPSSPSARDGASGATSLSGSYPSYPCHSVPQLHRRHSGDHSPGMRLLRDARPRHRAWDRCARQPRRLGRGRSGRPASLHCHQPVPGQPWPQPRHRPRGSRLRPSSRRPTCWARLWSVPSVAPVRKSGARSRAGGRARWRGWSQRRGAWLDAPRGRPRILSSWQRRRRHPTESTERRRR
jgi:hypothetical protein